VTLDTLAIAAGAFAINAGMGARDITNLLMRRGGQTTMNVRLELNVAGTLVAIGRARRRKRRTW